MLRPGENDKCVFLKPSSLMIMEEDQSEMAKKRSGTSAEE
jgi:hypothetical protein